MKKLIILFVCLILSLAKAQAGMNAYIAGSYTATTCSFSTSDADTLGESFEGANSGYDNSGWTETVAGGTSDVDPDAAHPGTLACTDKCSHAIKILLDGTNQANTTSPTFTAQSTLYTQFYIYISAEGLFDTESQGFFSARNTSTGSVWRMSLKQAVGGQKQLLLDYYVGGSKYDYGTLKDINIETWYRIAVKHVNGGTSNFYVDGTEVGTGWTAGAYDIDFVSVGWHASPTRSLTVYFDNLKIDNDTMPGACPE